MRGRGTHVESQIIWDRVKIRSKWKKHKLKFWKSQTTSSHRDPKAKNQSSFDRHSARVDGQKPKVVLIQFKVKIHWMFWIPENVTFEVLIEKWWENCTIATDKKRQGIMFENEPFVRRRAIPIPNCSKSRWTIIDFREERVQIRQTFCEGNRWQNDHQSGNSLVGEGS